MAHAGVRHSGRLAERFLGPLESLRFGFLWSWLILSVVALGFYLAWHAVFGPNPWMYDERYPLHITPHNATHLIVVVLIPFLFTTIRYENRQGPREAAQLRSITQLPGPEFAVLVGRSPGFRRRLHVAQAVDGLLGIVVVSATSSDPTFLFRRATWDMHFVWNLASMVLLFGLLSGAAFETLIERRKMHGIIDGISQIDLLDQSVLQPLWAPGLRRASYFVAGSCIASPLAIYSGRAWPVVVIVLATLVVATLSFLGPALAIRPRLIQAKHEELARIRAQIARVRVKALDPDSALDAGGSAALPGLLAYEARIETVREWPFGTPMLLRFAALLVLATGSWLGGALVERILGTVLD